MQGNTPALFIEACAVVKRHRNQPGIRVYSHQRQPVSPLRHGTGADQMFAFKPLQKTQQWPAQCTATTLPGASKSAS